MGVVYHAHDDQLDRPIALNDRIARQEFVDAGGERLLGVTVPAS
jgi:hypothetical protein